MEWLVYKDKCPECKTEPKGEVVRQIFSRRGYCSKNCGILLFIPSWKKPEEKVSAVCLRVGDGPLRKITRNKYVSLLKTFNIAAALISDKYPRLVDVMHALKSGELSKR